MRYEVFGHRMVSRRQLRWAYKRLRVMSMLACMPVCAGAGNYARPNVEKQEKAMAFQVVVAQGSDSFGIPYHALSVGDCFRLVSRDEAWKWDDSRMFDGRIDPEQPGRGRFEGIPVPKNVPPGLYDFDVMVGVTFGGTVCYSDAVSLQVQVVAVSTGTSQTICSGGRVEYVPECVVSGLSGAENYRWTREVVAGIREEASRGTGAIGETLTNDTWQPVVVKYVYLVAANECSGETSYEVAVTVNPVIVFEVENRFPVLCDGDTTDIVMKPEEVEYEWTSEGVGAEGVLSGKGNTIREVVHYEDQPAEMIYRIATGTGKCRTEKTEVVRIYPLPEIYLEMDQLHQKVTLGTPMTIRALPDEYADYLFRFNGREIRQVDNTLVEHNWNSTRENEVSVKVSSPEGCENTAVALFKGLDLALPNVITPNGDGVNDRLFEGYDLEVYNRNGGQLYKGKDGWDGYYRGSLVPSGTYLYVVWMKTDGGQLLRKEFYVYVKTE